MGQRGMDTPGEKKDITAALNQNQERQAPPQIPGFEYEWGLCYRKL